MEWSTHGPFVPNGILHRPSTVPLSNLLAPRVALFHKKIGWDAATFEAGHPGKEKTKEAEFNKDLEKAETLLRVLGWHHATERSIAQNLSKGKVEDLINSLLRRALYIATLKENQLLMFKEAKQYKANKVAEMQPLLRQMNPYHPEYKGIQRKLVQLKGLEVKMDPPQEVDWSIAQFQGDGLRLLQDYEVRVQRARAQQTCGDHLQAESPEVLDYLDCCVEQLGCLRTSDLKSLLSLMPCGEQGEQQVREDAPLGLHQLQLHDDGVRGDKDEDAKARAALIAYNKAIKTKKVALYRAVAMRQFVESYDAQMKDRERRINDLIHQLGQEHAQHKKLLTKDQQDEFFRRLLKDVHARRVAKEHLRIKLMEAELQPPIKARAYRPQGHNTSRDLHKEQAPACLEEPARSSPRKGGFLYWDAPGLRCTGKHGAPPLRQASAAEQRPQSVGAVPSLAGWTRHAGEEQACTPSCDVRGQRPEWGARPGRSWLAAQHQVRWLEGHQKRVQERHRAAQATAAWADTTSCDPVRPKQTVN